MSIVKQEDLNLIVAALRIRHETPRSATLLYSLVEYVADGGSSEIFEWSAHIDYSLYRDIRATLRECGYLNAPKVPNGWGYGNRNTIHVLQHVYAQ